MWNLATGECKKTFTGHANCVLCMALTSDNKTLITGSNDCTVRVWDLATGECRQTLTGHTGLVYCMALTTDNRTLITGSWDHTVRVWEPSIPQLNNLSHEQLLLVLKMVRACVGAEQQADQSVQELFNSLPEATRNWLNDNAGDAVRRLFAHDKACM